MKTQDFQIGSQSKIQPMYTRDKMFPVTKLAQSYQNMQPIGKQKCQ